MTDTNTAAPGTNRGPLITEDQLAIDHAGLVAQVDEMIAGLEKLPQDITGEQASALFSKAVIDGNAILKRVDGVRETEKEPYFSATKVVDGFFNKKQRDRLQPLVNRVRVANDQWLYEEAERKRLALEAESKRLADEAAAQAEEAAKAEEAGKLRVADVKMAGAVATDQAAQAAGIKAEGSTLDLSRTHLTGGGTVSVSTKKEVKSFDRDAVDLNALRPYLAEDAITKALAAALRVGVEVKGAVYGAAVRGNYRP